MFERKNLIVTLLAAVLFLAACNLPSTQKKDPNAVYTEAAATVQAQLTQLAQLTPSATVPPPATFTPVIPAATNPPANTPTATPMCDLALFVMDVTAPDGAQFQTGQSFTKTWRLRNIGVCTWTSGYQLIFESGDLLEGPSSPQALPGTVPPNAEVDISVSLRAPSAPGAYRGYWRLRNPSSVLVPVVSGYLGTSFFVDIKVVPPTSTPTMTATVTATATPTPTPTSTP